RFQDANVVAMLALGLALLVFFIDLAAPRGYSLGVLHLVPVLFALRTRRPLFIAMIAGICSMLVVVDACLSAPATERVATEFTVFHGTIVIGALWIAAGFGIERVQLENSLRQNDTCLRQLVQNMPVLFTAFGTDGKPKVWNGECERVTGYKADEVIGNS